MGLVYKSGVSYEQQREQMQAQETESAIRDIKDSIRAESNTRANDDATLRQDISSVRSVLTAEVESRTNADTQIQSDLLTETNQREAADNELQNAINAEKTAREAAESSLRNDFNDAIDTEKAARAAAIQDMATGLSVAMGNAQRLQEIENENLRRQMEADASAQVTTLAALNSRVETEEQTRATEDTKLSNAINAEKTARETADTNLQNTFTAAINSEKTAREGADTQLQTNLTNAQTALTAAINAEKTARESADTQIQTNLTNLQNTLTAAINTEKNAREAADTQLQKAINDAVAAETQNRNTALNALDASLKAYVDDEIGGVSSNLNDFTAPTATESGERGLVPQAPAGMLNGILTTRGWRTPEEAGFTIGNVPEQVGTLTYNGAAQSPTWLNFDSKKLKIEGTTSGTNAQTYTVTFTPLDIYVWADTLDQQSKTATWKIEPMKLAKPTASLTEFTFNGAAQAITVSDYNSAYESQTGTVSATNAGSYSAVYKLKNTTNTKWSDNTTADVTISWKINPLKLTKPTASVTEFTYSGTAKSLTVQNYNTNYITQTGDISAADAGSYSVSYSLKSTSNTKWADNSTAAVVINWQINPLKLTKPTASVTEFNYDGNTKTLSVTNYNNTYMNQTGNISASAVGAYSVVYSLKNTTNTKWSDNSISNVTISWEIKQSTLTEAQSSGFAQIGTLTYNGNTQTVSVQNYDPIYHDLSSTTSAVNAGTYTVQISPKAGTTWADGTSDAKSVTWKIERMVVQPPTVTTNEFIYDETEKTPEITGYDSAIMTQTGDTNATEIGDYYIKYELNAPTNYVWANTNEAHTWVKWKIVTRFVARPHQTRWYFVYNGELQDLGIVDYDPNYMSQIGTVSATDAGKYTVTYKLLNPKGTYWYGTGGSTADYVINWEIERKKLSVYNTNITFKGTSGSEGSYYNGGWQEAILEGYDPQYHVLSGVTWAVSAGHYIATVEPKPNYCWDNDKSTFQAKDIAWYIQKLPVPEPYIVSNQMRYDGTVKNVELAFYFDANALPEIPATIQECMRLAEKSGDWSGVNPGEYTATISLKNDKDYCWDSVPRSSLPYNFKWYINSTRISSDQSKNFIQDGTLTYNGSPQTVTITNYDPQYHALSGDITKTKACAPGEYYLAYVTPRDGYSWSDGTSASKEVYWRIEPLIVQAVTCYNTEFAYDGTTKTLEITGYNSAQITRTGTVSAKAVGAYSVTFALKDKVNSAWSNGSTDDIVINWSISLTSVTAPTISISSFTYNGNVKSPTLTGFNPNTMTKSGDTEALNAGEYTLTVALKDKTQYCWEDNSTDDLTYTWTINRKKLTATQSTFSQVGTLNYTGSSQNVTITNFDANCHSLSGTYISTNAGSFVAKVAPLSNYCFSDGTTAAKSVTWTINPIKLTKPSASVTNFTYDKQAHALTIANFNSTYMTQTGTASATNAGNYSVTYSLKNTTNTVWADNSTGNVIIAWAITKTRLVKPTLATSIFNYSGSNRTVSVQNFNGTYCTQSGVSQAKDAGNYSVAVSLNDNTVVEWEDGTTADVILNWTINKVAMSSAYSSPSQKTIPTFSGSSINLLSSTYLNNYNATYQVWSGTTSATNAGTYTAYVEPAPNFTWYDGTSTKKTVTWQITPAAVDVPEISTSTTLTYTGDAQSPTLTGYDANKMTLGSDTSKINAGDYTLTVSLSSNNYIWSDGTKTAKSLSWSIAPSILYKDFTLSGNSVTFNASTQTNSVNKLQLPNNSLTDYDSSLFTSSGTWSASSTGVYSVSLTFKNANYAWGASNNKTLTKQWQIKNCNTVDYPRSQNFSYDGTEHSPYNVSASKFIKVVSGTTSASAVGSYTTVYGLKYPNDSSWYGLNGNTENITVNWSIGVESVTAPTISTKYFDWDGSAKSVTISGFDSTKMTKTGTESATSKGFYTITFSLKDKTGTCWSTGGNADIVIEWAVGRKRVAKPTLAEDAVTEFEYSGTAKTLSVEGYNADAMTQSGYLSATDAGNYTVTYSLKVRNACDYVWQDNSRTDVSLSWKINKKALPYVWLSAKGNLSYDGTAKTVTINNFDASTMNVSGDTSAINAGTYYASVTPKSNYTWSDGTTTAKSVQWVIHSKTLNKPSASTINFDYDGTAKTLTVSNYNATYMSETGTTSAAAVGSYSAVYSLKDKNNTKWADGTTDSVTINWSIGGSYLAVPTISPASQISQGLNKSHSITVTGFDSAKMSYSSGVSYSQSGNTWTIHKGDAGNYPINFSLKDTTNTAWVGGSTSAATVTWAITKKTLSTAESTFVQTNSITCDGTAHSVTEAIGGINSAYIGEYYTLSSDTSATNAGTYTVKITPTAAAQWADKTTTAKTVTWTIDGAATSLTFDKTNYTASLSGNATSLTYSTSNPKITVKFTTNSNGDITFRSDDVFVVAHNLGGYPTQTVSASKGEFYLYPIANGTATITVTQAATSNFAAVTKYLTVTVTASTVLLKWNEIQSLAQSGNLTNYMRIGDCTAGIYLSGTVGTATIEGYYQFKLIGYNHNSGTEGSKRAHFMTVGVFKDSKYGSTGTSSNFIFGTSDAVYTTSPLRTRCTEFYNLLPTDLKNVIAACKKEYAYSNTSGSETDKVWLPSVVELAGNVSGVSSSAANRIVQYEYFANGNSRAFSSTNYWTRDTNTSGLSFYVDTSGAAKTSSTQNISYGFLPCFAIR